MPTSIRLRAQLLKYCFRCECMVAWCGAPFVAWTGFSAECDSLNELHFEFLHAQSGVVSGAAFVSETESEVLTGRQESGL